MIQAHHGGLQILSPAKINLLLAVTGRRPDGFHNLISLVAPLRWGDDLEVRLGPIGRDDQLTCDVEEVPVDGSNLILRAAQAYRKVQPLPFSLQFHLRKRIPMGAGLGGGSSNAVAALRLLQALAPQPLPGNQVHALAAALGSDCPLFLTGRPTLLRGRGDLLEELPARWCERLSGQSILLFKPFFSVSTPWAYREIAATPDRYDEARPWEDLLRQAEHLPVEKFLYNRFEEVVLRKFLILPLLFEALRNECQCPVLMSGSGSACYLWGLAEDRQERAQRLIQEYLGLGCFLQSAFLA